ncbi:MAG TPA: GSCFA domain-containing protein [Paludibacter sp.]|nr:GSCFA domain-containing protein [Paludibacter sp.]
MFQTNVEIPPTGLTITYGDRIMTLGSCFAENIGGKMKQLYFDTDINPFGVLYNPVSISNSIKMLIENRSFTEDDLFQNRGLWQSFSHSSLFSATTAEKCLETINERFYAAVDFLQETNFLVVTFGTAWVYEEAKGGRVVSNCHKLPASSFIRRRLTVTEIVSDYSELLTRLKTLYPRLQIIFSVSPIRHWKDGAHGNNVSKSTLLLAIEALQDEFDNVHYFPAYEIQLDELRDYRFYASDMLHPSDVAVDYIWQRFAETYFDEATNRTKKELEQLQGDLSHRPLFPDSEEYEKFRRTTEKRKQELINKYPFLVKRMK